MQNRANIVRTYVAKFPKSSNSVLARKLRKDYPGMWPTENAADVAVRRMRGKQGKLHRKDITPSHFEDVERSHNPLPCPPSLAEPWEPFVMDIPANVLILSDLHVPYHSVKAIEAAVRHGIDNGCESLLINGDLADWYVISRHQKDPRKPRLSEEVKILKEFLDWLLPQFPGQKVYKAGNHEERWDHFIWNNAPMFADIEYMRMSELLGLEERGCEWVTDQRVVNVGKLPVLHGHELPKGLTNSVNPARGAFLRTLHTVLHGHNHRPSTHPEPDMYGSETTCWTTGCLCDKNPEYARINKWLWGCAIVEVDADGEFEVHNYKINNHYKVRTV